MPAIRATDSNAIPAAQVLLVHPARMNSLASLGQSVADLESAATVSA